MNWDALNRFRPSRIGLRLFAFNLLVVFVPVAGILYLDVYEGQLRQSQESAMAQQARLVAAEAGETSGLDRDRLQRILGRLERRSDARLRVYDLSGALIADSVRVPGVLREDPKRYAAATDPSVRGKALYRLGALLANVRKAVSGVPRRVFGKGPSAMAPEAQTPGLPPEVVAALAGRYGAATRPTAGQRSLTLSSAVPIRHDGAVTGAAVASQSTYRILQALYEIRLRIFEIVVASVVAAAGLTGLAATTIVRPLTRLQRRALALAGRRGVGPATFPGTSRKDELGGLARSLEELTRRTNGHIDLLQSFSADVSHELKNPLASIRAAAEMMAVAESGVERDRFLGLMTRDVTRLERLISSLREVALVERQIEQDVTEPVDLGALLRDVVDSARSSSASRVAIDLRMDAATCRARASRERLAQVFENLVANAISFAPDGTHVEIRARQDVAVTVLTIDDRGPGIPASHLDRVFTRFFTYRPAEGRGDHVGLGLAIARQIVESYGGGISASNRDGGGARFEVRLPRIET